MTVPIYLNVYHLVPDDSKVKGMSRQGLDIIGMGIFHSGLHVFNEEISFGMDPSGRNDPNTDGIFFVSPRSAQGQFKEAILLGEVSLTKEKLKQILDNLRPKWKAASYHMLGHNCNCFTHALAEAIDPKLLANYPKNVNRAATAGNVVVPDALLKSLTDAIAPPTACAPDLINKLQTKVSGKTPKPLPAFGLTPEQKERSQPQSSGGGLFGMAKGLASKVESGVRGLVDDGEKKDFAKDFPTLKASLLVASYGCKVVHINRVQKATLYISEECVAVAGSNQLQFTLPYEKIASLQYGISNETQKNVPPSFSVVESDSNGTPMVTGKQTVDSVLIYCNDSTMVPIFDIGSGVGSAVGSTVDKISGSATPVTKGVSKAITYLDQNWRKKVRV